MIARKENEPGICALLLRETSTIGIRIKPVEMLEAHWEIHSIETRFGPVPVKLKYVDGEVIQAAPEFEVCARVAEQNNVPVSQVIKETEALAFINQQKTQ